MGESSKYEITVEPRATYVEDQSDPSKNQYVFAYTISVTNTGTVPAQLISRHWIITDANGHVEEVKGEGVVGETPRLGPGERFEYRSWAMLRTPFGTMRGSYTFARQDGSIFQARIAEFALTKPNALN